MKTAENKFDDIRPYCDSEIHAAMNRIADDPLFPVLSSFVFPERPVEEIREMVRNIDCIRDFQMKVMYTVNRQIIDRSTTGFSYSGIGRLDPGKRYTFVSNHRDIMLDASILQMILAGNGLETTEITFGANLMQGGLVVDIGKSNKMFRVERPGGSMREFLNASRHLSEYIRHTVLEKRQSVWIAQRNGRTKDGIDRTDQGIINMLRAGGPDDKVRSLCELNIVPVAVSYEWEPCDILKAAELCAREQGPYAKKPGEDLNSILTGIRQPKGRVHFSICRPVTEEDLEPYSDLRSNDFNRQAAALIDRRICSAYRLMPNNYIAHDILSGTMSHSNRYTPEERAAFIGYMSSLGSSGASGDIDRLRSVFLGIYANPVDSAAQFAEKDERNS